MGRRERKKRGFPVGILIGFDEQVIHIWKLFSESIKKYKSISIFRKWKNATEKDKFHFYEDLLDNLRPLIDIGLKSIILVTPQGSDWSNGFLNHIEKHHRWLISSRGNKRVCFTQVFGKANSLNQVKYLLKKEIIQQKIEKVTSQEAYLILKELEKAINIDDPNLIISYGLEDVENVIFSGGKKDDSIADKVDYLLLTNNYLENHPHKNRVYRLKQIAKNKGIIVKVISEENSTGERINQFGGIICFKTVGYF